MLTTDADHDSAPRAEKLTDAETARATISYGMRRAEYDRLDRVHWSKLKLMLRSAAHYRHAVTSRFVDTDAMKLGRAVHLAMLEPTRFQAECVLWEGGARRGKDWEKFQKANADREILTEREWKVCGDLAAAVRGNADAMRYLSGARTEASILWQATGEALDSLPGWSFDLKSRLDAVRPGDAIADLKTTRDASINGFGREAMRLRYHAQAALYSDAYTAATGERLPYVLVAVETAAPHLVVAYRVTEEQLAAGREMYRSCLQQLGFCIRENRWPGYAEGEQSLSMPDWALPPADDDVSELGLDFTTAAQGETP